MENRNSCARKENRTTSKRNAHGEITISGTRSMGIRWNRKINFVFSFQTEQKAIQSERENVVHLHRIERTTDNQENMTDRGRGRFPSSSLSSTISMEIMANTLVL